MAVLEIEVVVGTVDITRDDRSELASVLDKKMMIISNRLIVSIKMLIVSQIMDSSAK